MRGGESIGWALAFEFAPAAIFGSATAYSAAIFLGLPQFGMTPIAAGAAAFGGIWLGLNKFGSRGRALPLPEFEQPPLELSPVSELLEQADVVALVEQLGATPAAKREIEEELVLEDVLEAIESEFPRRPAVRAERHGRRDAGADREAPSFGTPPGSRGCRAGTSRGACSPPPFASLVTPEP